MLHRHLNFARPGTAHFVTTVTSMRGNWFIDDRVCLRLLKSLERARAGHQLKCLGYVLMPDHVHLLLWQDQEGKCVPDMMESFKKWSSRLFHPEVFGRNPLWRRGYDDVPLPGSRAMVRRLHYMHNNPVKRGLVQNPEEYRWSSFRPLMDMEESVVALVRLGPVIE